MIKYMLTSKCNRNCEYCITKNIRQKEVECSLDIINLFTKIKIKYPKETEIMLTGGEPTLAKNFISKIILAREYFDKVFLTTQNEAILNGLSNDLALNFNAITFSLHDKVSNPVPVQIQTPVYASILAQQFFQDLPDRLRKLGYAGLTINEEQRNGFYFNDSIVQEFPNFSLKINRRGHCLKDIMILPDLTVIHDFTPYL